MLSFSSGLQDFCREIHGSCFLINKALFFSGWFWDFFPLCLVFIGLIMLCQFMDFFEFILFEVYSSSWIYRFMYFIKLGKFLIIISLNIFSMRIFSPFFQDSEDTIIRPVGIVLEVPDALFCLFYLWGFFWSILFSII